MRVQPLPPQAANLPMHLSKDIPAAVLAQQEYASSAFQAAGHARALEAEFEEEEASAERAEADAQAAADAEARKVRKDPRAASFHGGFEARKLQMVPVGGALGYSASKTQGSLGAVPPLPPPRDRDAAPDVATGGMAGSPSAEDEADDAYGATAASPSPEALALLADPLNSPRGGALGLPPLNTAALTGGGSTTGGMQPFMATDEPPQLPPPNMRLSSRVPPSIVGTERPGRVGAPTVSQMPANANPNLMNLLLEVPYKRGVHTVSVNQRYLNHEPTFDAAFELLPARVDFGQLGVGGVYRFALKLVNVSNLTQRFTIKQKARVKLIYQPGAIAAGMALPLEVEVCEATAGDIREVLTIVTEREEISLPVAATILDTPAGSEPPLRGGVRLLSTAPRDPALSKTVAPTVNDFGAGTKRFHAPPRNPEYVKPDFFGEPPDDDGTKAPA